MYTRLGNLRFDPDALTLMRGNRRLALRPKTATALAALLRQRGQIVSKSELAHQVWGGRLVSEQSLFQAISELRRALDGQAVIVTHPNLGYSLTPAHRGGGLKPLRLAASLLLCTLVGAGSAPRQAPAAAFVPPAIHALADGVAQLRSGQFARAAELLDFALSEDPSLYAASALLAEARLQQGRLDEADRLAQSLLDQPGVAGGSATVSAMTVLSRVHEKAGQPRSSLQWARSAHDAAQSRPMACAAIATGRLLAAIEAAPDGAVRRHRPPPVAVPLTGPEDPEDPATSLAGLADGRCEPWLEPAADNTLGACLPQDPWHRPTALSRWA